MRLVCPSHLVAAACCLLIAALGARAVAENPFADSPIETATTTPQNVANTPSKPQRAAPSPPASAFPRPGARAPVFTQPFVEPQVTNQTRQALGFYGGYSARATLSQMPRRMPIQTSARQLMHRSAKPFQAVHRDPTVSPYLNLYREEQDSEGAPNYFAFVRPQMEQIEVNRMQQREIQHLRGQVQGTVAAPGYQAAAMPGTGTPARFMDTAQFYGGLQR